MAIGPCGACDGKPVVKTFPKAGASYKALGKGAGHRTGGPFVQYCGVCSGTGEGTSVPVARPRELDRYELQQDNGAVEAEAAE